MPALALAEPEHPFGPEHRVGELVVEEVLEAAQIKRRVYRQGYGAETLQLRRMGVVMVMGSIGLPPAELGKLIGAALVGTFLGILMSYSVVGPIASALEQNEEVDGKTFLAVKAVLLASLNGFPPQAAVEFGRKVLFSDMRPSFKELDEETKAVKGK